MNYRVLNWLIGYDCYRVSLQEPAEGAELLLRQNVPFWGLRRSGERELSFCASVLLRKRLRALWAEKNATVQTELWGMPRWLCRYRKRWGVLAGVLCFAWLLQFSSSHIWQVRVVGAEADEGLKARFAAAGLWEGMAADCFDSAAFASSFLADNSDYSYVSAGIHGAVALVWLHSRESAPAPQESAGAANLVAAEQGEILRCEASYGQVMVIHGDIVQKGQLLVSGVVETKNGGYRLENASGRVLARVKKEWEIFIPLAREEKVYIGEEKTAVGIRILGKNINFFSFYEKNQEFCDTIDTVEEFTPLWGLRMPFFLVKRTYAPYRIQRVSYSEEEASRLAYDEYHRRLEEELGALEVIEEHLTLERDEACVRLKASVWVVMDIAQRQEITVGELVVPSPKKG